MPRFTDQLDAAAARMAAAQGQHFLYLARHYMAPPVYHRHTISADRYAAGLPALVIRDRNGAPLATAAADDVVAWLKQCGTFSPAGLVWHYPPGAALVLDALVEAGALTRTHHGPATFGAVSYHLVEA